MSEKWIPVSERLPEEPKKVFVETDTYYWDCKEYIITIDGAKKATVGEYAGDGKWKIFEPVREGEQVIFGYEYYNVVAWMPKPEAYREGEA